MTELCQHLRDTAKAFEAEGNRYWSPGLMRDAADEIDRLHAELEYARKEARTLGQSVSDLREERNGYEEALESVWRHLEEFHGWSPEVFNAVTGLVGES